MAKQKQKRVMSMKVKRTIRKTSAAVLMASAIAVAAIPAGNIEAQEHETSTGVLVIDDDRGSYTYLADVEGEDKDDRGEYKDSQSGEGTYYSKLEYEEAGMSRKLSKYHRNSVGDYDKSYSVTQESDGRFYYDWQFEYDGNVLCKYNSEFARDTVEIPSKLYSQYYKISTATYNRFYELGTGSEPLVYMYDDWMQEDNRDDPQSLEMATASTLNAFFPDKLASMVAKWKEFQGKINDLVAAKNAKIEELEASDVITPAINDQIEDLKAQIRELRKKRPGDVVEEIVNYNDYKAELVVDPSAVENIQQKQKYFCANFNPRKDAELGSTERDLSPLSTYGNKMDFTLVEIRDKTSGSGAPEAYMVQYTGAPNGLSQAEADQYGFLVTKFSNDEINHIGDYAFYGVGNVKTLDLRGRIKNIGDYAFAGSFLERILMDNVTVIGNAAFKDCKRLTEVTIGSGLKIIGTEAFCGSTLPRVQLPYTVRWIGPGAFAKCTNMTEIDLSAVEGCEVGEAVFYDAQSLNKIIFPPATKEAFAFLGKGAFAVGSGNVLAEVDMPARMKSIPDYLFAGRTNLKTVVMPAYYGSRPEDKAVVPATIFVGCTGLQKVVFPEEAKYVNYMGKTTCRDVDGNKLDVFTLFLDVDYSDFCVEGPAYSTGKQAAYEREDTWHCITNAKNFVPYIYKDSGTENYEFSDGKLILTANGDELLTCQVIEDGPLDLVIPQKVGDHTIKTIASGCFDDPKLKKYLRSLTIEDGTISGIQPGVFEGMMNLKWVILGNSVENVGARAFYNCPSLIDVTFRAETVMLGDDAFAMPVDADKEKLELTFHGKIAEDFEPFRWAMQLDNYVNRKGVRVCYKSLSPSCLTVILDDGNGLTTLVDYPKYKDLDRLHNQEMVDYWYATYGTAGNESLRIAFYNAWKAADAITDVLERKSKITAIYNNDSLYGPWVNPEFCNAVADGTYDPETFGRSARAEKNGSAGSLLDSLLPALKVYAAGSDLYDKPTPYFSHKDHQYSIINKDPASGKEWESSCTKAENDWIDACENIVVPSGVESIDAWSYYEERKNSTNVSTYFMDVDTRMLQRHKPGADGKEVIPGAFSGWYDDYDAGSEYEVNERGNDRLKSITLTSVKYLPDMAFDSCERLEKVDLGANLTAIGALPFYGCTRLREVVGNEYYLSANGLILDTRGPEDGKYTLVECLPGRGDGNVVGSASVPDEANEIEKTAVERIGRIEERAFEDCDKLTTVNLANTNIETIPERCFEDCERLKTVYLPASANSIKARAFKDDMDVTVSIPSYEVFIATDAFEHGEFAKNDPGNGRVTFQTYPESAAAEYARYYDISLMDMGATLMVWFRDYDGTPLIEKPIYVKAGDIVAGADKPEEPKREGFEFVKWISNTGKEVDDPIEENTTFTATYNAVEGSHDGKYFVVFYDGVDGKQLGDRQEVGANESADAPDPPKHSKYKFVKWSTDEWENVQKDLTVVALYSSTSTGGSGGSGGGGGSGGSGGSSGGGSTGGNTDNNSSDSDSSDKDKDKDKEEDKKETKKYNVTVKNGTGSGSYEEDATVAIVANTPEAGKVFSKWTTEDKDVTFVNAAMSATTFKMPAKDVTVTAEYVDSAATATPVAAPTTASTYYPPGYGGGSGTTGSIGDTGNTTNRNDGSNAQVTVSKPGISNIDLATAKVNGSSDSFIIKVTETNEAEEKVRNALTNRYGSIDNRIKYWACDISLYDSTGNTKIEDTTGLTVDITLPIPDELRAYGGNAMVGAVADNVLESLSPRFNEINGVPCVTFTATHFSPYTIYVDTQNLSASQMLDATPKTGDPIHPKWFLSIGLAAVSVLLFMKKDKKNNGVLKTA